MPFEIAETVTAKAHKASQGSVSYMRYKRKDKDGGMSPQGRPRLFVSIPTTIFLSKAEKFVLLIGTGADAKKIRIKAASKGDSKAVEVVTLMHAVTLRFGFIPKFGDEIFDRINVETKRLSNDEYEIELPMNPCTGS